MTSPARIFEDAPAVRRQVPLLLGVTGPSGSGKTFSALELATGMQRAIGGEIFGIDTEARRMLHYADRFKFRHVDFQAPFGPLDYLAAIEHCVKQGAKILVIDSMTHEHNGVGGVMDQVDAYLDRKCGDDEGARKRHFMLAQVKPKAQRKMLNNRIVQLGINAVFCYRAADKIKPIPGKEPEKLGWQAETTSPLVYEMTQRFLLAPASDGRPTLTPETNAEKLATKTPEQFRGWFSPGFQLNADLGEKLARWALGGEGAEPRPRPAAVPTESPETQRDALLAAIEIAPSIPELDALKARGLPRPLAPWKDQILAAFQARRTELENPDA